MFSRNRLHFGVLITNIYFLIKYLCDIFELNDKFVNNILY